MSSTRSYTKINTKENKIALEIEEFDRISNLRYDWEEIYDCCNYTNCVYVNLIVLRKPLLRGPNVAGLAACLKLGKVFRKDGGLVDRLKSQFAEYNAVWIVPILVMQGNTKNISSIESTIKEQLVDFNVKIACSDKAKTVSPKEFFAIDDDVIDTVIDICEENGLEQVINDRPRKGEYFAGLVPDNIEKMYKTDIMYIEDQSDNLSQKDIYVIRQTR